MEIRSIFENRFVNRNVCGSEGVEKNDIFKENDSVTIGNGNSRSKSAIMGNVAAMNINTESQAAKELEQSITTLESLLKLMESMGNHGKSNEIKQAIENKKKQLEIAKQPGITLSDDFKNSAASYINSGGKTKPPSGLSSDEMKILDSLISLVKNGMHFSDSNLDEIMPEDVYCRLLENKVPDINEQVRYKTYEDGKIVLSTLRPEYVNPLNHFVVYTQKGFVFFRKDENGYSRITSAKDFIDSYKNDYETAVVKAIDDRYVTPDEAIRIKTEREIKGMMPEETENTEKPRIINEDDFIIIGGVILKKKN